MSKRALKSKNTKAGSRKQHKQMKMNEENVSLVTLPRDTDVVSPDVQCQKTTQDKYVHKKFKRIANVNIDDNYNQKEQSNNSPNAMSTHIQSHINENRPHNEPLTDEKSHLSNNYRPDREIKASYESSLPIKDISQNVSSAVPVADDIIRKSTSCPNETPSGTHGSTSSQQSFGSNISFNEPCKPYKPKFHKVCSISPTEQNPENMLVTNRSPIDYSKKSCASSQQQVQMAPRELEPLNLSNRRKLSTVEPLYGISSTCNLQSATYLDEPIASPGPFLGKTRLVDDYSRRRVANQPNQTVNNFNKLNHIGISAMDERSVSQRGEMDWKKMEKTNEQRNTGTNAIDLNIISSTSEFNGHPIVADPVKLVPSPVDPISMQIAEVSSSVNSSMAATAVPHALRSLPHESKVKTAGSIVSEYIELTNKQIHSTTNDEHAKQPPIVPIGPVRPISIDKDDPKSKSSRPNISFIPNGDGPLRCTLCSASFPKSSLLKMHMNIHYMNPERKFHCDACDKSFRTQNRLQKHTCFETKTVSKVNNKNPRPFKCADCSIAFRGHGFLAKHLRSKTHIQNLENLQKIPSGTYVMIEKAQINLTDIDTTDCDSSLTSLKILAKKLNVDQNSIDTN